MLKYCILTKLYRLVQTQIDKKPEEETILDILDIIDSQ